MEGKEKLIEALKNIDVKELAEPRPVFSPEEYEAFVSAGMTKEEIGDLEKAEMLSQVIELLPTDKAGIERLIGALGAVSTNSDKQNLANLLTIAQKDPNMLVQMIASTELFN